LHLCTSSLESVVYDGATGELELAFHPRGITTLAAEVTMIGAPDIQEEIFFLPAVTAGQPSVTERPPWGRAEDGRGRVERAAGNGGRLFEPCSSKLVLPSQGQVRGPWYMAHHRVDSSTYHRQAA
jgi:hypothetical protein